MTIPNTFYRSSAGGDRLLREKGWLHLHVGRDIDDNILLIVEQIKEGVIFICLADHEIFKENPLGNSLSGLNSKIEQEKLNLKKLAATKQTSPVTPPSPPKVTNADLRAKLLNKKPPQKESISAGIRNSIDIVSEKFKSILLLFENL